MKRPLLVLCLLLACLRQAYSQNAKQNTQIFYEKVYLHTDRDVYVAGEDIWYSTWLVNAQDNHLINTSHTLYVELAATDNRNESNKQLIALNEGKGHGDFELDEDLKPGLYEIRAWTNWMRNFGNEFVFSKQIRIVGNPLLKEDENAAKKTKTARVSASDKSKPATPSPPIIQFLPEGGSMINDVASVVAFSTRQKQAVDGEVINSRGELVASLNSEDGRGIFMLKPVSGETYTAKGSLGNGKAFQQVLPAAAQRGYSLHVTEKDSLFQVIISTNAQSGLLGKDILLVGKSHGIIKVKSQLTMKSLQQVVSVYKDNFPPGIAALTIYDQEGKPQCERLIFVRDDNAAQLTITPSKASYQPNEPIDLLIKTTDKKNKPLKTSFSMAALDAALAPNRVSNIASYLLLESELKGEIDNPTQYFNEKDPRSAKKLDLLLLTQGWRDFLWKRMADTSFNIHQIPESGITISGSVKRKVGDKPIAQSNVTVRSVGEKQSQLFSGNTDDHGRFYLDGFKFNGPQKFSANAVNKKGNNEGWIKFDPLFKPLPNEQKEVPAAADTLPATKYADIATRYREMKRRNSLSDTIMLEEVRIKQKAPRALGNVPVIEFGYADEEFIITERDSSYYDLRHYLLTNDKKTSLNDSNFIVYRWGGTSTYPRFFVNNKEMFFSDDWMTYTTVSEDGSVLEADNQLRDEIMNNFLSYRMADIEKVLIKHMVGTPPGGQLRDYFLIFLTLKEGASMGAKKNPIVINTNGYYEARTFFRSIRSNIPDQSINLYWNPLILTDEKGEASVSFRAPGASGEIRLDLQGISERGSPVFNEQKIMVK